MPSSSPLEEDSSPIPWSPSPPRRTLALKESIAPIPSCSTRLRDITIALSESRAAIQSPAPPENPPSIAQNTFNAHVGVPLSMTPTHALALEAVKSGKSIVIHGGAFSGKTRLLQRIIQCLHSRYPQPGLVVITATTAQSACRLGGVVLQEFIGRFSNGADHCAVASSLSRSLDTKRRLDECRVLIIDDIHLLDARILNIADFAIQIVSGRPGDFGELQLIVAGDFFQMTPEGFSPLYAFEARSWPTNVFHLQDELSGRPQDFVHFLQQIRTASVTSTLTDVLVKLSREVPPIENIFPIRLVPTDLQASKINDDAFDLLHHPIETFMAVDTGPSQTPLLEVMTAQKTLRLKLGCQVMLIRHVSRTLTFGSLGRVVGFVSKWKDRLSGPQPDNGTRWPLVRFFSAGDRSNLILVGPFTWKMQLGADIRVSRTQVPLLLGWAASFPGSHGSRYDRLSLDFSLYPPGTHYFALSRATSLHGVQVIGYHPDQSKVDPKILAWAVSTAAVQAQPTTRRQLGIVGTLQKYARKPR